MTNSCAESWWGIGMMLVIIGLGGLLRQPITWGATIIHDRRRSMTDATQEKRLTHTDCYVRKAAVRQGGLTPEQHERALRDKHRAVRAAAVALGGLTPEQHERALRDVDYAVRRAARAQEAK